MTNHELCHYYFFFHGIYIISDLNYKTLNTVKTIKGIVNGDKIFWINYPFNIDNYRI